MYICIYVYIKNILDHAGFKLTINDLELMILLPLPHRCEDYMCEPHVHYFTLSVRYY